MAKKNWCIGLFSYMGILIKIYSSIVCHPNADLELFYI